MREGIRGAAIQYAMKEDFFQPIWLISLRPPGRYLTYHASPVSCIALSSDSRRLAVAPTAPEPISGVADVCVWDLEAQGPPRLACCLRYRRSLLAGERGDHSVRESVGITL